MKRVLFLCLLLMSHAPGVLAHELRPAYLELRQTRLDDYDVLWKVPARLRRPATRPLRSVSRGLPANHAQEELCRWGLRRPLECAMPWWTDRQDDSHRRAVCHADRCARAF